MGAVGVGILLVPVGIDDELGLEDGGEGGGAGLLEEPLGIAELSVLVEMAGDDPLGEVADEDALEQATVVLVVVLALVHDAVGRIPLAEEEEVHEVGGRLAVDVVARDLVELEEPADPGALVV